MATKAQSARAYFRLAAKAAYSGQSRQADIYRAKAERLTKEAKAEKERSARIKEANLRAQEKARAARDARKAV